MKIILAIIIPVALGASMAQASLFTEDFNESAGTAISGLSGEVSGTSWTTGTALTDGRISASPGDTGQDGSNVGDWNGTGNEFNVANFASTALSDSFEVSFKAYIKSTGTNSELLLEPNDDAALRLELNESGSFIVHGANLSLKAGSDSEHFGADVWQDITIDYTVTGATTYEMAFTFDDSTTTKTATFVASVAAADMNNSKFYFGTHGGNTVGTYIDDISIIPEPATLGLVASFGGAVLFIRRRLMI